LAQDHAEYVYEQLSADNPWGRPENLCPRDGRGSEKEGKVEGERRAGQHLSQRALFPIEGKLDPDFTPSLSEDLRDVWRKRIVGAAQRERTQADRSRGLQSGHLSKIIDELAEPTVHWTQHLQRFVTTLYSGQRRWTPPNRRQVYRGLYLPSTRSVELNIAVAIDTSGSTNSDLPQFLGELRDILRSFGDYNLRLIQCDSVIQSDERYCANEPFEPSDVEMKGFGGRSSSQCFGS
jgi:predicted metal-dependent peptidase